MTSCIDHGVTGARASRPQFDRALDALVAGDTLVITTLDRLCRSTQNMLTFAQELNKRGAGLRVLNPGGGNVDTYTSMGSMLFTIMAALAQMEHEIKSERITDSQIHNAIRLINSGESTAKVTRDLGMSRATFYRRTQPLTHPLKSNAEHQ